MMNGIYFVTDADATEPVHAQALAAARAGVRWIQLRDKTADNAAMIALARDLRRVLRPLGTRLIINDRIEVALAARADGLHIGQSDGDPQAARARIGPDMILGLSVEDASQLDSIPAGCVDYLGVGPIRATASKADHAAPIGFEGLRAAVAQTDLPVVAIGGLVADDAAAIRSAGACGMAVVSAISRAPSMADAAGTLVAAWRQV
ncbi:thiamine phosphate synthase [Pseudohalocynthiibacter aestuariivivens]|nr:thiamine phosphate synthase [Pseudohalocynthiibacter aestuariivivens]QIE46097.1 thiamine phosphate synthase [Pseudohalocynthiibacter aestuariivivens]